MVPSTNPKNMNDEVFRKLVLQYGGSVLEALVRLVELQDENPARTAEHTADSVADHLGIQHNVLEEALQPHRGRTYAHVRRSVESQVGLSQYLLDELLGGRDG